MQIKISQQKGKQNIALHNEYIILSYISNFEEVNKYSTIGATQSVVVYVLFY